MTKRLTESQLRLSASLDMLKAAKYEPDRVKLERIWYSTMCLLDNQIEVSQSILDFLETVGPSAAHGESKESK